MPPKGSLKHLQMLCIYYVGDSCLYFTEVFRTDFAKAFWGEDFYLPYSNTNNIPSPTTNGNSGGSSALFRTRIKIICTLQYFFYLSR